MTATSIYDTFTTGSALPDVEARSRTRRLRRARVAQTPTAWRSRQAWLEALRRGYEAAPDPRVLLQSALAGLERDVRALEARASRRPPSARREPVTIRAALELLRRYARCLATDWSWLDTDDRDLWRQLLELEHRACYAAAGTTRIDFEGAVGRTGAR